MEIILKNGEVINLEWNAVVIEYLEDYENGIGQIILDLKNKNKTFKTINFMIYCFVSAVYPKEIGYREAISLINPSDLDKIIDFMIEKMNDFSSSSETQKVSNNVQHRR